MAIIYEDALKNKLKSGELLPVYIFFGDEGYLKKLYCEKISKKIAEPDDIFNYSKFTDTASLQEVYDAVMQMPFASDKKYVEFCDFPFENASKSDFEKLCDLLSDLPDTTVLVLRFDKVEFDSKKSAKFKKIVALAEKSGGAAVCFNHRTTAELVKILTNGALKRGARLDAAVARYLIETVGEDIMTLSHELEKICAFSEGEVITRQMVDRVCVKSVEAKIYDLFDFIYSQKAEAALKSLDELFYVRIEPMRILYTISSVYVDMFRLFSAKQNGASRQDVIETYNYKGREFAVNKAENRLYKFDTKRLELSLSALINADNSLKSTGANPRVILEQLIIELIFIMAKGESIDKA